MASLTDIDTVPAYSPTVLKNYYRECLECLRNSLPVAAILLSSACLEIALLDAMSWKQWKTFSKRYPERMDFIDLLDWGRQVGCISKDGWKRGHRIRDYRNALIHPGTDYKKVARKYPKMAKLFRELKRNSGTFDRSGKLKSSLAFLLMSREMAKDVVSDVHALLEEVYTRGPFHGGKMMSLRTGKDVPSSG